MEFHKRIRELRKELNEPQTKAAEAIGITLRQYQRFEKGEQKPGFDNLCAMADHFGVTLDYLMCRTDER